MAKMKQYLAGEFSQLNDKIDNKFENLNNKLNQHYKGLIELSQKQFAELYEYLKGQFRDQGEIRAALFSDQWAKIKNGQFQTSRNAAIAELTGELRDTFLMIMSMQSYFEPLEELTLNEQALIGFIQQTSHVFTGYNSFIGRLFLWNATPRNLPNLGPTDEHHLFL